MCALAAFTLGLLRYRYNYLWLVNYVTIRVGGADKLMGSKRTGRGKVEVGEIAPNFTLTSQSGETVSLKDFVGKTAVVLYFYPKDETPGCTKEACAFRDDHEQFRKLQAEVLGVSSDPVESHQQFAEKYSLPFTLLSDEVGEVRKLYGVPNALLGLLPGRVTYVIDKEGVVRQVFSSRLNAIRHVEEAIKTLGSIASEPRT
jgi:peroxiredoxin Q/BCP